MQVNLHSVIIFLEIRFVLFFVSTVTKVIPQYTMKIH